MSLHPEVPKSVVHSRLTGSSYLLLEELGKGTTCHVYAAINKSTGTKVAVKVFRSDVPFLSMVVRYEADVMNFCMHKNVLRLLDADVEPDTRPYFLVMNIMKIALDKVKKRFAYAEVKRIMKQLLTVVRFCHRKRICHFDIKPSNILFDSKMNVKLADWGLACQTSSTEALPKVAYTANYRPPELLLGARNYDPFKAEMWAVGAVFAFLLMKNQDLFAFVWPENTRTMLTEIFKVFGKPDELSWPGISLFENYSIVESISSPRASISGLGKVFKDRHTTPEPGALDLLQRMMTLDPSKRISAKEALESSYFVNISSK